MLSIINCLLLTPSIQFVEADIAKNKLSFGSWACDV